MSEIDGKIAVIGFSRVRITEESTTKDVEGSVVIFKETIKKSVTLAYDGGLKEDKYGRKLAYVFCEGITINELMFKSGYGIVAYTSKSNTSLLPQMLESEKHAKASKTGVWSIKGFVDEEKHHGNRIDAA